MKEKANITRITAEAGGRANAEAAEREKENAEIARVAAQASEKAKAEAEERKRETVRVSENVTKSSVEEAATEIRARAEAEIAEIERA